MIDLKLVFNYLGDYILAIIDDLFDSHIDFHLFKSLCLFIDFLDSVKLFHDLIISGYRNVLDIN